MKVNQVGGVNPINRSTVAVERMLVLFIWNAGSAVRTHMAKYCNGLSITVSRTSISKFILVSLRAHGGPIHITFDRYRNLPLFKLWLLGACRDLACVKIPAITNVRVKSYRCERNAVPK